MDFRFDIIINAFPLLIEGAIFTIQITALSVAIGIIIGLFVGVARISKIRIIKWLAAIYVDFLRGTPLLVQIFLIYFALPVLTGIKMNPFVAAIAACSINSGAYVAEIFRAGIQSIDNGQMEAGRSLGLSWFQTMRYIIIPQAFKNIFPALGNEFIVLLKETSVSGYIAMQDLTKGGDIIRSRTYDAFMPLIAVALIYLVIVMILTAGVHVLERRLRSNER